MEPRGLDFLRPIWQLMQPRDSDGSRNEKYIGLESNEVRVYYTKYTNNFKPQFNPLQPGQTSIRDAVNDQLTPGKHYFIILLNLTLIKVGSVYLNGSPHAMVLDTINDNDELVFKNTHGNNKKYKLPASDRRAPDEFYFIHIEPLNNQIRTSSSSSSHCFLFKRINACVCFYL